MRHALTWRLARTALRQKTPVALVTVAAVKGSAPREAGACMCITADECAGTIGGGTLEYKAIAAARELLAGQDSWLHQQLGLGPALGQCCGGRVELLLEQLDDKDLQWLDCIETTSPNSQLHSTYSFAHRRKSLETIAVDRPELVKLATRQIEFTQAVHPGHFHLLLFGAGHLGKALTHLLATLPCTVHWVDSRADCLPESTPQNIRCEWLETPTLALQDAPPNSFALVMTHNHALDFEITAAALARANFAWVGMIGSNSKRQQFERHLRKRGALPSGSRFACPIGESSSDLRDPAELAIALAGTLLQARRNIQSHSIEMQHHA